MTVHPLTCPIRQLPPAAGTGPVLAAVLERLNRRSLVTTLERIVGDVDGELSAALRELREDLAALARATAAQEERIAAQQRTIDALARAVDQLTGRFTGAP